MVARRSATRQGHAGFTLTLTRMTRIAERTILFADLRGSTALYETLGNAEATSVVTHTVSALARAVPACGGQLIKTLGDGLMAAFNSASEGLQSAQQMHEELEGLVSRGRERGASAGLRGLRLQVALARGEVVEMGDARGRWWLGRPACLRRRRGRGRLRAFTTMRPQALEGAEAPVQARDHDLVVETCLIGHVHPFMCGDGRRAGRPRSARRQSCRCQG
mgnify:CR=1 FL=1